MVAPGGRSTGIYLNSEPAWNEYTRSKTSIVRPCLQKANKQTSKKRTNTKLNNLDSFYLTLYAAFFL